MSDLSTLHTIRKDLNTIEGQSLEEIRHQSAKVTAALSTLIKQQYTNCLYQQAYTQQVLLEHIRSIDSFLHQQPDTVFAGHEKVLSKSLKYHFASIIDSYIFCLVAVRQQGV